MKFKTFDMTTDNKISEIRLYYKPRNILKPKISCSEDTYRQVLRFSDKNTVALHEQFIILYLNSSNMVLGGHKVFTGGLTGTITDIRLILGITLKSLACVILISHNHHSGNLNPSEADRTLTDKVKKACDLMDIKLHDHIIISPHEGSYYSFADEGLI